MRQGKTEAGPYALEVHCSRRVRNYDLSQFFFLWQDLMVSCLEEEFWLTRTTVFDFTIKLLLTQLYARLSTLAQALQPRLPLVMIQWAGRC